ncbi:unnamed protein product [Sphagnum compactum]
MGMHVIRQMLRVNQAGELTACSIYRGQLAVLGRTSSGPLIEKMLDQEKGHLDGFNHKCIEMDARPTLLSPLCSIGGWILGAGTALVGRECAMACTEAVENVVGDHYNNQLRTLFAHKNAVSLNLSSSTLDDLVDLIAKCRDEELEHRNIAIENHAHQHRQYRPGMSTGYRPDGYGYNGLFGPVSPTSSPAEEIAGKRSRVDGYPLSSSYSLEEEEEAVSAFAEQMLHAQALFTDGPGGGGGVAAE